MRTRQVVCVWEKRKTEARKTEKKKLRKLKKAEAKAAARKAAPPPLLQEIAPPPSPLREALRKRSPKTLADRGVQSKINLLEALSPHWVRGLDTWKKKGKSPKAVVHSLAVHLIAQYHVPQFLWEALYQDERFISLVLWIGAGKSLRMASFLKQMVPTHMTKRMWHLFLTTPGRCSFVMAVRRAQILGLGGSFDLWKSLGPTNIGENFGPPETEEFRFSVIQWFCNHPLIAPDQIGPLIDYITHLDRNTLAFSMKGRSANALFQGMENWHQELVKVRRTHGLAYMPSGFQGWENLAQERVQGSHKKVAVLWEIKEILNSKELAAEGRALHHCVVSYGRHIAAGRRSIWSLQKNGERRLTIEVRNSHKTIVQIRGPLNRRAGWDEGSQVRAWAATIGLQVSERGW